MMIPGHLLILDFNNLRKFHGFLHLISHYMVLRVAGSTVATECHQWMR